VNIPITRNFSISEAETTAFAMFFICYTAIRLRAEFILMIR